MRADPLPILAPAVADYRVEWDFNEHFWVASILAGPGLGHTKRYDPETLRLQQWKGLEELSLVEGFFSKFNLYTKERGQGAREAVVPRRTEERDPDVRGRLASWSTATALWRRAAGKTSEAV